jgi:hypothetical protein
MGFGRRAPDTSPGPSRRAAREGSEPVGPAGAGPDDGDGDGKLLAQLAMLTVAGAIALFAALGLPSMMSGGSSSAFKSAGVPFDGQFAPGEQISRGPALQSVMDACLPPLSKKGESRLGRRGGFYERLKATGASSMIDAFSGYLVCSMSRERQRLCDSADRDDLLNEFGHYFKRIAEERIRYERRSRDSDVVSPKFMAKAYAHAAENIKAMFGDDSDGISTQPPPPPGARSDVLSGIGELISEGYISARNFGSSPPEELAAVLANTERRADRCK